MGGGETSPIHWDALKEALQSGLVTGEVIVKGLGKMTLQSLVARMER